MLTQEETVFLLDTLDYIETVEFYDIEQNEEKRISKLKNKLIKFLNK